MNDLTSAIKDSALPYSGWALMGMITVAFVASLFITGFLYRAIRTISAVKQYDAACAQVKSIEEKLTEMSNYADAMQRDFDKKLAEAKEEYARELFEVQQIIFERNSEILDLKNKLIQMSKSNNP